ncbi:ATP-binding cassette domain-containing protein, partial [Streptomyces albidoflavus]|uniref:ATP-binding cassette domain-containing protein n=1 Tax=Streptomyces albidoflavus TaxID=1886 RepID=UPI0033C2D496
MSTATGTPGAGEWAVRADGIGKRYRRGWALRECSFRLPAGRICGLVGPNGAGKSTLLGLMSRQLQPTEGELRLFGTPVDDPAVMPRFAFLGQDKPLFKRFTVAETLRMGGELNPGWDMAAAERIVRSGGVPLDARVGGSRPTCCRTTVPPRATSPTSSNASWTRASSS